MHQLLFPPSPLLYLNPLTHVCPTSNSPPSYFLYNNSYSYFFILFSLNRLPSSTVLYIRPALLPRCIPPSSFCHVFPRSRSPHFIALLASLHRSHNFLHPLPASSLSLHPSRCQSFLPIIPPQNHERETALHCAAQYGHSEVVSVLLQELTDPTMRNSQQETPLDLAALYGRLQVSEKDMHHFRKQS